MDILTLFFGKNDKALKYMHKRYGKKFGDEFTIVNAEYAGLMSRGDTFFMESKRFPGFTVIVERLGGKYYDSYMELHFYKQYQEYMQPIVEEILGECKVFLDFSMQATDTLNQNTTFEEYMRKSGETKYTKIIVPDDSNMKEKLEKLGERLKELQLPDFSISVRVAEDYEKLSQMENMLEVSLYEDSQRMSIYKPGYNFLDTEADCSMNIIIRE